MNVVDSAEAELFKLHREGQNKYIYFLLAAAGTALGFALTQTRTEALSWSQLPLGAAAICWAASFYLGCERLTGIDAGLYNNTLLLKIQQGRHPDVGRHPQMIEAAASGLSSAINRSGERIARLGRWQFRLLIGGAGLYVAWHVLEMAIRQS